MPCVSNRLTTYSVTIVGSIQCSKYFQIPLGGGNNASWYVGDITTSASFEAMRSELLLILKEALWDSDHDPSAPQHSSQEIVSMGNWREFKVSKNLLSNGELDALRKLAQNGADFKVYFLDQSQAVFPVVRVLSHPEPSTIWMYCMREGHYTLGFALSASSGGHHCQCWIGPANAVDSFESFFGGTNGSILLYKDISIRLFYKL